MYKLNLSADSLLIIFRKIYFRTSERDRERVDQMLNQKFGHFKSVGLSALTFIMKMNYIFWYLQHKAHISILNFVKWKRKLDPSNDRVRESFLLLTTINGGICVFGHSWVSEKAYQKYYVNLFKWMKFNFKRIFFRLKLNWIWWCWSSSSSSSVSSSHMGIIIMAMWMWILFLFFSTQCA